MEEVTLQVAIFMDVCREQCAVVVWAREGVHPAVIRYGVAHPGW